MKIKMHTMAIIVFIVIFGGIAATMAVDIWTTSSNKIPAKYTGGEFAGVYNPQDIRGSYTFEEVSNLFEIDLQVLYKAFGIAENTDGTKIKTRDLETLYSDAKVEIGNESAQVFVALYKNLPIALDDVYFPKQAVDILLEVNLELTPEQKAYLQEHQVEISKTDLTIEGADDSEVKEEEAEEIKHLVNGSTTFQQVLDGGITKEQIEKIIGKDLPATNQTIKDYCIKEGMPFSGIKDQLNQLAE